MNNDQRAQTLYELLKKDSEGCFDVKVERFENQVSYQDQGGFIGIDFDELTLTQRGNCCDTFGMDSRKEIAETYVTENTINVEFWISKYGSLHASITHQYNSLKELREMMSTWPLFEYLEGIDEIFKED